jgi:hypothetical protein
MKPFEKKQERRADYKLYADETGEIRKAVEENVKIQLQRKRQK